jgi:hypothetical protein
MSRSDDERILAGRIGETYPRPLSSGAQPNELTQCLEVDILTDGKNDACAPTSDPAIRPRGGRRDTQQASCGGGYKQPELRPHDLSSLLFR